MSSEQQQSAPRPARLEEIRREVKDKLDVAISASLSPISLYRVTILKQCEDFLVDMVAAADQRVTPQQISSLSVAELRRELADARKRVTPAEQQVEQLRETVSKQAHDLTLHVRKERALADAAEMLWVVLANVNGGDWTKQSAEWQEAAARWRDTYFAAIRS
jgi:hypothetical protein